MIRTLAATRAAPTPKTNQRLAWNDIEALPIYAAMALCFACSLR